MIRRTSILLLEVTIGIAAVAALLIAGSVWKLSQAPQSIRFLLPYAEEILNRPDRAVRVEIEDLILAWGGWERALDIRAIGVRLKPKESQTTARIREVSVSFSLRALVQGRLAPTSLEVLRPRVVLVREADGRIGMGFADASGEEAQSGSGQLLPLLLAELSGTPGPDSSLRYLNRVSVIDADLRIDDRKAGAMWTARDADISLRRAPQGLRARFDVQLGLGNTGPALSGTANYTSGGDRVAVDFRFSGIDVAGIGRQVAAARDLAALKTVIQGGAKAEIALDGGVLSATFDASSGPGTLTVPGADAPPIPFRGLSVAGTVSRNPGQISIERAVLDLGTAQATARAVGTRVGDTLAISASADVPSFRMNDLGTYWVKGVGGGARDWVVRNMRDGTVKDAVVRLTARVGLRGEAANRVDVDSINGRFNVVGATVDYLDPMPPIRGAVATATFSDSRFDFAVTSGNVGELRIEEGAVNIWDIGAPREMLAVSALIRGPVRDALDLVAHPRLNLLGKVGLTREGSAGRHATRLSVALPLLAGVKADDVAVSATSNISGLALASVLKGQGIEGGKASLRVDNSRMRAEGDARFAGAPAQFVWEENFTARDAVRRKLTARLTADERIRRLFDVDFPKVLAGPVEARVNFEERRTGTQALYADLTLDGAKLTVPGFDWAKAPGREGKASFRAGLRDGRLVDIPAFTIEAGVLGATGRVVFATDGRSPKTVRLERFALGATEFSATADFAADGRATVSVMGTGFDATPFLSRSKGGDAATLPAFSLSAVFDKLWVGRGSPLADARVSLARNGVGWESYSVGARLPEGGKEVGARMGPTAAGQEMTLYAADAGSLLKAFEISDSIREGSIELRASRGTDRKAPWTGRAEMKRFTLVGAPTLARILTLASLTGIGDVLRGNGVGFDFLRLGFEFDGDVATISEAQAVGSELGITGGGKIDLASDSIDLGGTIVPAYTLNSLLGKIPLIGPIITGEKGGGIFAATYSVNGALAEPDVSVNPLSALAPGFLRRLFGGSPSEDGAKESEKPVPKAQPRPGD
jgi:hypothetical protein